MTDTIVPRRQTSNRRPLAAMAQRLAQSRLLSGLAAVRHGRLTIIEPDGRHVFGEVSADFPVSATIHVRHPRFWSDAAFGGNVSAGEAYVRGDWDCDDLTAAVRIMLRNRDVLDLDTGTARLQVPLRRALHWLARNTESGSRRNIAAHYDIGNDLFEQFLDPTLSYSCCVFEHDDATLEEAAVAKMERICRKLDLTPDDHLLEIGTGWGGLAIHAAREHGCRVTTTTVSAEQHRLATQRVREAGLEDRVTVLDRDYRRLEGRYDKLVSVEMIEAVGHEYHDTFFRKCGELLEPHGSMLLQTITIADQQYDAARRWVDFIQRYIFPGGCLPSLAVLTDSVARVTDMRAVHMEDIGPDYALTLRHWRRRFFDNLGRVRALGYPESFVRLWEFYLCYCEGGFMERTIGDIQLMLTKPACRARAPLMALGRSSAEREPAGATL